MSKLKDHLTEAKTHVFMSAWENHYQCIIELKNALGDMIEEEGYAELRAIVLEMEKHYARNTKNVMKATK